MINIIILSFAMGLCIGTGLTHAFMGRWHVAALGVLLALIDGGLLVYVLSLGVTQ